MPNNGFVFNISKAIFTLIDTEILKKIKRYPKDHTERFEFVKSYFPEIYSDLEFIFGIYRQTYRKRINEVLAKDVFETAKVIFKFFGKELKYF